MHLNLNSHLHRIRWRDRVQKNISLNNHWGGPVLETSLPMSELFVSLMRWLRYVFSEPRYRAGRCVTVRDDCYNISFLDIDLKTPQWQSMGGLLTQIKLHRNTVHHSNGLSILYSRYPAGHFFDDTKGLVIELAVARWFGNSCKDNLSVCRNGKWNDTCAFYSINWSCNWVV